MQVNNMQQQNFLHNIHVLRIKNGLAKKEMARIMGIARQICLKKDYRKNKNSQNIGSFYQRNSS